METVSRVLAMYDVRGIQQYIYRTSRLKDAMGASRLIDNIITRALEYACRKLELPDVEIIWEDAEKGIPKPYNHHQMHDVQVLYIGGGNAFVSFINKDLCVQVNQKMAKYILEKTYSLQLAAACVPMSENYAKDYHRIYEEMNKVKSHMTDSRPLGTLPVMCAELKTGLPVVELSEQPKDPNRQQISRETYLKWNTKNQESKEDDIDKILDNYARRGENSRIAVVHIDGNNMGMRIRRLVENVTDYQTAVERMRRISCNIKYSYLNTFRRMKEQFNQRQGDRVKRFVREIIVAGDDITYVCNAYIAMETVEWFCREISKMTMNAGLEDSSADNQNRDIQEYGFSVCAGIAYIHSHFPFGTAYEVAENCCDFAKDRAKAAEHKVYYRVFCGGCEPISSREYADAVAKQQTEKRSDTEEYYFEKTGNFFDFLICKNIQCLDLQKTRDKEYITASGEHLLIRPYYIPMPDAEDPLNRINVYEEDGTPGVYNYDLLKQYMAYFSDAEHMPRSFAKKIRNTYSLGENQINLLAAFLDSRQWKLPDGQKCTGNMYVNTEGGKKKTAKWYDALELIDYNLAAEQVGKGDGINADKED